MELVLWSPTATISLGIVNARFVNEKGQVAGTVLTLDDPAGPNTNPFLWDRGVRTDMGPIPTGGMTVASSTSTTRARFSASGSDPRASRSASSGRAA